jgi:hypothetical protein
MSDGGQAQACQCNEEYSTMSAQPRLIELPKDRSVRFAELFRHFVFTCQIGNECLDRYDARGPCRLSCRRQTFLSPPVSRSDRRHVERRYVLGRREEHVRRRLGAHRERAAHRRLARVADEDLRVRPELEPALRRAAERVGVHWRQRRARARMFSVRMQEVSGGRRAASPRGRAGPAVEQTAPIRQVDR